MPHSPLRFVVCLVCLFSSVLASPPPPAHRASLQAARAAKKAGDANAFLQQTTALIEVCRDHPDSLLFHAEALALAGRTADARSILRTIAQLGVVFDPTKPPAFADVRGDPEFAAVVKRIERNGAAIGVPEIAFTLPAQSGIIEGIARDARRDTWYISDVRHRQVLRQSPDGTVTPIVSERDGLASAFGLAVDAQRDLLWICASPSPAMVPASAAGTSELVGYDLAKGQIRFRQAVPADFGKTLIGDLALAADGTVYLTDTDARVVWCLRAGADAISPLCADYGFASLQGLALKDPEHLLVADYVLGLFEVNTRTGAVRRLPPIAGETLVGIDGMRWHEGRLYLAQNGVRPNRIAVVHFDPAGNPRSLDVLLRGPGIVEPTLFTAASGELWCVANSGWDRFQKPTDAPLPPVDVRIVRLSPR